MTAYARAVGVTYLWRGARWRQGEVHLQLVTDEEFKDPSKYEGTLFLADYDEEARKRLSCALRPPASWPSQNTAPTMARSHLISRRSKSQGQTFVIATDGTAAEVKISDPRRRRQKRAHRSGSRHRRHHRRAPDRPHAQRSGLVATSRALEACNECAENSDRLIRSAGGRR